MLLLIDNYDSFTFNLAQLLESCGANVEVVPHDAGSASALLEHYQPTQVVLSPGPGRPEDAGVCLEIIQRCATQNTPLLGVCLGHQCLAQAFGAAIVRSAPIHGKAWPLVHDQKGLFQHLPSPIQVARYHSLVVDETTLPGCLEIHARTPEGLVMALRHRDLPLFGIQFHPESFLSQAGAEMMHHFLQSKRFTHTREPQPYLPSRQASSRS